MTGSPGRDLVHGHENVADETERDAFAVFILIGATPRTPASIARDARGFALTGRDLPNASGESIHTLGTSAPGIYAAGDVRHGSVKRVAAAVGEGSTAIREIHEYLAGSTRTVETAGAR